MLFSRLRKHWELLPYKVDQHQHLSQLDLSLLDEASKELVEEWKASTLETLSQKLDFKRDDYKEFLELCIVFLGGKSDIRFGRPGALHKARWMAKILYAIKICLLETPILQLPPGTISTQQQLSKLKDFVLFATLIYSSWWFSCESDLQLYQNLLKYAAVNPVVSSSAIRAFNRHLWYLSAEMVPLALFSDVVPDEEKQSMANKLLAVKPTGTVHKPCSRHGTGFGRPNHPKSIDRSTSLSDLITKDSWFTMQLLDIDHEFLSQDVGSWEQASSYQSSKANATSLNVVNDSAERGVKLSSDFLATARTEGNYQNNMQVAEQNRKQIPNLRKRTSKDGSDASK